MNSENLFKLPRVYKIIYFIGYSDNLTSIRSLSKLVGCSYDYTYKIVYHLQFLGYVKLNHFDGVRSIKVYLTAKGVNLLDRIILLVDWFGYKKVFGDEN